MTDTADSADAVVNFNPRLATSLSVPRAASAQPVRAGVTAIESVSGAVNLPWQSRPGVPSDYEVALAAALRAGFEAGAQSLEAIVEGLNARAIEHPDGGIWTTHNYPPAMRALAGRGASQ